MNCDEFAQLMHERLDHRQPIGADEGLRRHARQCDSCRAQMDAWQQLAKIMPAPTGEPAAVAQHTAASNPPYHLIALAAAVLIVIVPFTLRSDPVPTIAVDTADSVIVPAPQESDLAHIGGDADPAYWWRSVQNRDWVGQTMPTVRSVQEGVAPIGRSLMRAVTILTTGAQDRTS